MIEPKGSFPVFIVKDLDVAKSFYLEHLGFDVVFSGDWYIHLVSRSGVQVGFLLPDQPSQPPIFHKQHSGEGVIFNLEVEDADAAYAAAKSQSLTIVLELRSEDWGQRHFCIQDPNGVYLDIVQSFEPTEEYRSDYVSERNLTDLRNIGKKISGRLNEVGVFSEGDLRQVGAVGAHSMIRDKHPNETLPVCYYLYSFEGALTDKHWNEISEQRKQQLRAQVSYQQHAADGAARRR